MGGIDNEQTAKTTGAPLTSPMTTPEEYMASLDGEGRIWLAEFLDYMRERHGALQPIMFRQRPMFKVGKSYVLFTVAKEHFAVHTLNFDLIEAIRKDLPKAKYGKGCVQVKFADVAAKPALKALCDEVVRLNSLPNPPEVDVTPSLPYEENLRKAFSSGKAKWLPLYEVLRDQAKAKLSEFTEYFPAANVLWKHGTTFAQISAVSGSLRVEFFASRLCPERNPIKVLQTSANRVAHTVECRDENGMDEILGWIAESYQLTNNKSPQ